MTTKLVRPVNEPHTLTSPYGPRTINGKPQFHKGLDYVHGDNKGNYHRDKSVVAVGDGVCVFDFDSYDDKKRWNDPEHSAGNMVVLEHLINGKKYFVRYLHLMTNCVKVGQKVKMGEKIGVYGDAGISYGAHVHIDMWDANWKQIDPTPIMLAGLNA